MHRKISVRKPMPGAPAGKKTGKQRTGPIRPVPSAAATPAPSRPKPQAQAGKAAHRSVESARPPAPVTATPVVPDGPPDFLFISYAWENIALAEWLARKLMAEGYNIWRDGQQMFGGEV